LPYSPVVLILTGRFADGKICSPFLFSDLETHHSETKLLKHSGKLAAGKSAELHIYAKGGHGFGMREQKLPTDQWIERFGDWLGVQGLLRPRP